MRPTIGKSAIFFAALAITLQGSAFARTDAGQQFPGRPMPPDLVAPPQNSTTQPAPHNHAQQAAPAATPHHEPPAGNTTAENGRQSKAKASPVPPPQTAVAPAPSPPPLPPTPQQMPAAPPLVVYLNGLLTISANNSTLADVLNAVRERTGASMTVPPSAGADRVFIQIGPAAPRDAVAKLLAGTNFDYILLGSATDRTALKQVILTVRQGADAAPAAQSSSSQAAAAPAFPQQSRLPGMGSPPADQEPAQQPFQPFQPLQQQAPTGSAAPGNPRQIRTDPAMGILGAPAPGATGTAPVQPPAANPQQPKTPEQLLEELKRMQNQPQRPPQ